MHQFLFDLEACSMSHYQLPSLVRPGFGHTEQQLLLRSSNHCHHADIGLTESRKLCHCVLSSFFEHFSSVWGGAIGIRTNWSVPRSAPQIKGESQGAMELSSNGLCSSSPGTVLNTTLGRCCCRPVQRWPVCGQGIWRSSQTRSAAGKIVSDLSNTEGKTYCCAS